MENENVQATQKLVKGTIVYKALKKKKYLTVREFAYCLNKYVPLRSFKDLLPADKAILHGLVEPLEGAISSHIEKKPINPSQFTPVLCGIKGEPAEKLVRDFYFKFPISAYKKYCKITETEYPFDDGEEPEVETVTTSDDTKSGDGTVVIYGNVTVKKLQSLIKQNQELGDVLAGVVEWTELKKDLQYKEKLKEILSVNSKNNNWGWGEDYSISKEQLRWTIDIFLQSSKKVQGQKEPHRVPELAKMIKKQQKKSR